MGTDGTKMITVDVDEESQHHMQLTSTRRWPWLLVTHDTNVNKGETSGIFLCRLSLFAV